MFQLKIADVATADGWDPSPSSTLVRDWTSVSGRVCAVAYVDPAWRWIVWDRVATFRFRPDSRVIEALPCPGAERRRVEDIFRRSVLPIVLQASGRQALHASAVLSSEGVLAFCGNRGAGKSTIAFALSHRGFTQYADDVLIVDVVGDSVEALSLPFAPRLRKSSAQFFHSNYQSDALSPASSYSRNKVRALFVFENESGRLATPAVVRLTEVEALASVARHGHCFNPRDDETRRRWLQSYLEIAARVPVFSVRFSHGLDQLEPLLDRLLESADVTSSAVMATC